MNLKLVSSMAGDRFSFRPGQVIKCSDATGSRLLEAGHAKPAPAGAEVEGELHDEAPEEHLEKKAPARAVTRQPETPEKGAAASDVCAGSTKQGNPCKSKKLVSGTEYCEAHQDQAKAS